MAKYDWYTELSEVFMGRGYFQNNATIQDRVKSISDLVGTTFNDEEIRAKAQEYMEEGFYVLPSPVWSNVGTKRGAGISCFGSYIGDSVEEIIEANAEVGMLCKIGGGTAGYFGDIRGEGSPISTGGISYGSLHFAQMFDSTKKIISQNNVRRGEFAGYWPITHPDIQKVLNINGEGSALQRFPFGVCVETQWLKEMREGDEDKQDIWAMVLDSRSRTGFPYLFFKDNVNKNTVDVYKDLMMEILFSQMCAEILLPASQWETFVCNLIGMNLEKYDQWKHTDAVRIAVYIADAVLTEFIEKYKHTKHIQRAIRFAERHRAIALGASGYHSYLQSKMIPFESFEAKMINVQIFKTIQTQAWAASEEMATRYGKPELLKDDKYKRRHTTLTAVAPNTSSSFIMNQQSQSIEPYVSNYYTKKADKVEHTIKNPYLKKLLAEKGKDTFEVWESILKNEGSVQHLDFLDEHEKLVFRTFIEISQLEIVIQASARQKFIDQGQSLNLMIHPDTPTKDINKLTLEAHDLGIKTLYYQLGQNAAQAFARNILSCDTCSG
jgi:ribonucleoside-diphosphate reductase alpha chain